MFTTSEIIEYFVKYIAPISIAFANFFKLIYKIRFGFLHVSKSKTERIFTLFSQDTCKNTANRYALYIAVADALSSFYPIPEIEFAFARSNPLVMLRDMRAVRHLVRLNPEKTQSRVLGRKVQDIFTSRAIYLMESLLFLISL